MKADENTFPTHFFSLNSFMAFFWYLWCDLMNDSWTPDTITFRKLFNSFFGEIPFQKRVCFVPMFRVSVRPIWHVFLERLVCFALKWFYGVNFNILGWKCLTLVSDGKTKIEHFSEEKNNNSNFWHRILWNLVIFINCFVVSEGARNTRFTRWILCWRKHRNFYVNASKCNKSEGIVQVLRKTLE